MITDPEEIKRIEYGKSSQLKQIERNMVNRKAALNDELKKFSHHFPKPAKSNVIGDDSDDEEQPEARSPIVLRPQKQNKIVDKDLEEELALQNANMLVMQHMRNLNKGQSKSSSKDVTKKASPVHKEKHDSFYLIDDADTL